MLSERVRTETAPAPAVPRAGSLWGSPGHANGGESSCRGLRAPKSALDRLIPAPRLVEIDRLDLAAPPAAVWERVRHGDLAPSRLIRALFAIRTWGAGEAALRVDELTSTPERPGFQLLVEEAPRELAVGAIGRVWEAEIPFVHVATAAEFAAFDEPGYVRVAWSLRILPRGADSHLELEVRVDATDEASWRRFRRYFVLIGVGSRFIRSRLLRAIARELGKRRVEGGAPS